MFGYAGAANAADAGAAASLGLVEDLFGSNLNAAAITKTNDKAGAACQSALLESAQAALEAIWTETAKAKKSVLAGKKGVPPAESGTELQDALLPVRGQGTPQRGARGVLDHRPLAASAGAGVPRVRGELRHRIEAEGRARAVAFGLPGSREPIALARSASERAALRATARRIVARLGPGELAVTRVLENVGALAGFVSEAGLEHLLEDPAVVAIGLDWEMRPQLAEAVPLATPRSLSGASAAVEWRATRSAYGGTVVNEDPDGDLASVPFPLRLPGQQMDDESGRHYNQYRVYDTGTGRYLEADPIGMNGGINLFEYVAGNPVSRADPLGLSTQLFRRWFYPYPPPIARHCFIRFNNDTSNTLSFDTGGVHPDPAPPWWPQQCTQTQGPENDPCVRKAMRRCKASQYHFTGFNCCHCAEQALKACGLGIPLGDWPNWPVNPGPQPGEPGYTPVPREGSTP